MSTVTNICLTIIALLSTGIAVWTLSQNRKQAYTEFFRIIEKHHSNELTERRETVISQFEGEAGKAEEYGLLLKDSNPEFSSETRALINYYESMGMFLKGGSRIFSKTMENQLLEMLRVSTIKYWKMVEPRKGIIKENPADDWCANFEWLYQQVREYEDKNGLKKEAGAGS